MKKNSYKLIIDWLFFQKKLYASYWLKNIEGYGLLVGQIRVPVINNVNQGHRSVRLHNTTMVGYLSVLIYKVKYRSYKK